MFKVHRLGDGTRAFFAVVALCRVFAVVARTQEAGEGVNTGHGTTANKTPPQRQQKKSRAPGTTAKKQRQQTRKPLLPDSILLKDPPCMPCIRIIPKPYDPTSHAVRPMLYESRIGYVTLHAGPTAGKLGYRRSLDTQA